MRNTLRIVLILGCFFLFLVSSARSEDIDYRPKQVIIFSGSWCPFCQYLENHVLPDEQVRSILYSKYTLRRYEVSRDFVPEPNGAEAFRKYGVRGLPTIVLATADGDLITKLPYAPASKLAHDLLSHVPGGKPPDPLPIINPSASSQSNKPGIEVVSEDYIRSRMVESQYKETQSRAQKQYEKIASDKRKQLEFLEDLRAEREQSPLHPPFPEKYLAAGIPEIEIPIARNELSFYPTQYRIWRYVFLQEMLAQGLTPADFRQRVRHHTPFHFFEGEWEKAGEAAATRLNKMSINESREIFDQARAMDCSLLWKSDGIPANSVELFDWLKESVFAGWSPIIIGATLGFILLVGWFFFYLKPKTAEQLRIPDPSQHLLKIYGNLHPYMIEGSTIVCQGVHLPWSEAKILEDGAGYDLGNGMQVSFIPLEDASLQPQASLAPTVPGA